MSQKQTWVMLKLEPQFWKRRKLNFVQRRSHSIIIIIQTTKMTSNSKKKFFFVFFILEYEYFQRRKTYFLQRISVLVTNLDHSLNTAVAWAFTTVSRWPKAAVRHFGCFVFIFDFFENVLWYSVAFVAFANVIAVIVTLFNGQQLKSVSRNLDCYSPSLPTDWNRFHMFHFV